MPSVRLGFLSGGTNILSGNYFSGQGNKPVTGVQLFMNATNSGLVYVAFSGGITTGSGVFQQSGSFLSGLGKMDGLPILPGQPYFVPKGALSVSGSPAIFVQPDALCSGQAFVSFECL